MEAKLKEQQKIIAFLTSKYENILDANFLSPVSSVNFLVTQASLAPETRLKILTPSKLKLNLPVSTSQLRFSTCPSQRSKKRANKPAKRKTLVLCHTTC